MRLMGMLVIVVLACVPVCSARILPIYWSEPTTARVVVDGVGDPVPGVVVVAAWTFTGFHNTPSLTFEITETVTDEQGRFHIPGWGPRVVWPWQVFEDLDPRLLLFKPGFKPRVLKNGDPMWDPHMNDVMRANRHKEAGGWGDPNYVRRSYWTGRAISFTRKEATWDDLEEVYWELGFAFQGYPCGWKKLPRLLDAMLDMAGHVDLRDSEGRPADGRALMLEKLTGPSKPELCGSVEELLRSHP